MAETKGDSLLWFRMKNGLVDVVNPPTPGPGLVLAQWPDALAMLGVKAPWSVTEDFFYLPNARGAARRYAARDGLHTRSVELFLSANGFAGAVDQMVEWATTTMLPEPPFSKAPEALRFGELTLASHDPTHRSLIWTFHNLCLRVDTSAGGEETLALCRRLLGGMQRKLVDAATFELARPRIGLPKDALTMDKGGTVHFVPTAPGAPSTLQLALFPADAKVAVIEQGLSGVTLQGLQAGPTMLGVVVADPATLACASGVVRCVVR